MDISGAEIWVVVTRNGGEITSVQAFSSELALRTAGFDPEADVKTYDWPHHPVWIEHVVVDSQARL